MGKSRVTILGGGLSGLVTAYNLTDPSLKGQYEVTIYQLGWRLGGKCATGRNADVSDRIQEHGLHVFMGQYDNAFRMIQNVYAEAPHPPFANWRDGFTQEPAITLMEEVDGKWQPWVIELPVFPGTPGIDTPPSLWKRIVQMLESFGHDIRHKHAAAFAAGSGRNHRQSWWRRLLARIMRFLGREVEQLSLDLLRAAIDAVNRLDPEPARHTHAAHHDVASAFSELRDWIQRAIRHLLDEDTELRHWWITADLTLSTMIGGLRDGLFLDPDSNLERVNQSDYKAWLRSHGADQLTVESAIVRGLYDLIFAYPCGDWQGDGNVEAGTLVLSLMNTMTYQGSIIWKFNTATGDLVAAPMYEVLKARGVNFEFFARVDKLVPAADGSNIASVELGRQVTLKSGRYDPLRILPSGQRVWPDRPDYDQIVDGEKLRASGANLESWWTTWPDASTQTLVAGTDYDLLVLAIPPAAHRDICADLISQKREWQAMASAIQTTATQSLQTWTTVGERDLGWEHPAMVGAFDSSNLNSWADISEVLKTESWSPSSRVVAEQIACGPLPCPAFPPPRTDSAYPANEQVKVDTAAQQYLNDDAHVFWSKGFPRGGPRAGMLASTYSRANIDPGERYTLTVANSTKARLRTCDSTYANLYLSGDWIQNGQNLGSFEATTVSGMLASRAISGFPSTILRVDAARYSQGKTAMLSATALPKFVDYGGMTTFPGKIELNGTTMWAFMFEAEEAKLEAWCNQVFTTPSNGAVRVLPLAPLMMMTIVDIAKGRFVDANYMGWSSERELTFWIPAVRVNEEGGKLVATHFDLALPYLVLDNPVAIASGREIFGYFKQAGVIGLPGDPGNTGELTVDVFATKTFGAESEEIMQRLLTLTPIAERPSTDMAGVRSFEDAARALHAHVAPRATTVRHGIEFGVDILTDVFKRQVPQLFLKQFRDVADGRFACYQAITEAMGEVTRFDAFPHLVEYEMMLEGLASTPVAADFGILPSRSITGVRLEYDMVIHPGRVLWQA